MMITIKGVPVDLACKLKKRGDELVAKWWPDEAERAKPDPNKRRGTRSKRMVTVTGQTHLDKDDSDYTIEDLKIIFAEESVDEAGLPILISAMHLLSVFRLTERFDFEELDELLEAGRATLEKAEVEKNLNLKAPWRHNSVCPHCERIMDEHYFMRRCPTMRQCCNCKTKLAVGEDVCGNCDAHNYCSQINESKQRDVNFCRYCGDWMDVVDGICKCPGYSKCWKCQAEIKRGQVSCTCCFVLNLCNVEQQPHPPGERTMHGPLGQAEVKKVEEDTSFDLPDFANCQFCGKNDFSYDSANNIAACTNCNADIRKDGSLGGWGCPSCQWQMLRAGDQLKCSSLECEHVLSVDAVVKIINSGKET